MDLVLLVVVGIWLLAIWQAFRAGAYLWALAILVFPPVGLAYWLAEFFEGFRQGWRGPEDGDEGAQPRRARRRPPA